MQGNFKSTVKVALAALGGPEVALTSGSTEVSLMNMKAAQQNDDSG
jgi:hypothetical protein